MDVLIGMKCEDFVIIAADKTTFHGIMIRNADENKLSRLSEKMVMAVSGSPGDTVQFSEFVAKNIHLYKLRSGYDLAPKAVATFTRQHLAEALRTRYGFTINVLMAGFDNQEGPQLFFIDYLGTMVEMNYAAHGFGGLLCIPIMDLCYSPNMSRGAAAKLLKNCVQEVHRRYAINVPNFQVQVVHSNGIDDLPPITANSLLKDKSDCLLF